MTTKINKLCILFLLYHKISINRKESTLLKYFKKITVNSDFILKHCSILNFKTLYSKIGLLKQESQLVFLIHYLSI